MPYADVDVVVEGAQEDHEVFTDYLMMNNFIEGVQEESRGSGAHTEVFVLWHDHEMMNDCICSQSVTDHAPSYEWNKPAS